MKQVLTLFVLGRAFLPSLKGKNNILKYFFICDTVTIAMLDKKFEKVIKTLKMYTKLLLIIRNNYFCVRILILVISASKKAKKPNFMIRKFVPPTTKML